MNHIITEEEIKEAVDTLQEEVKAYLDGEQTLSELWGWFAEETWEIEDWASPELCQTVYAMKLRIYEYQHGDWAEDDLKGMLALIVGLES